MNDKTKYIIVGSGAGGATLARELTKTQKNDVVIIERGARVKKVGNMIAALRFYDAFGWLRSIEETVIYRAIMTGGTTVVSCGNMVRIPCLQKKFLDMGIDLENYYHETEQEMMVKRLTPSPDAIKISIKAGNLGYMFSSMPKAINVCRGCGNCVLGCKFRAKWTALNYLDEAISNGARLITRAEVIKIINIDGKTKGVEILKDGNVEVIMGDVVILAAGGLGTPVILQKSGIDNAGKRLFCDLFSIVYGTTNNRQKLGLSMSIADMEFRNSDGFILSPFIDPFLQFVLFTGWQSLLDFRYKRTIGMMIKIADQRVGRVNIDGTINKEPLSEDIEKLNKGENISKEILAECGARRFRTTAVRGAHPGGTAAIGEVVDNRLQTEIKNLFVCDASVLPFAPGLPPILTIVALAKWLTREKLQ